MYIPTFSLEKGENVSRVFLHLVDYYQAIMGVGIFMSGLRCICAEVGGHYYYATVR